ncbi:MAG: hypothetical protein ACOC7X_08340 [Spirochaetota bacterium]
MRRAGYPQTSDDITIGILDLYSVDYSQEQEARVRYVGAGGAVVPPVRGY